MEQQEKEIFKMEVDLTLNNNPLKIIFQGPGFNMQRQQ